MKLNDGFYIINNKIEENDTQLIIYDRNEISLEELPELFSSDSKLIVNIYDTDNNSKFVINDDKSKIHNLDIINNIKEDEIYDIIKSLKSSTDNKGINFIVIEKSLKDFIIKIYNEMPFTSQSEIKLSKDEMILHHSLYSDGDKVLANGSTIKNILVLKIINYKEKHFIDELFNDCMLPETKGIPYNLMPLE